MAKYPDPSSTAVSIVQHYGYQVLFRYSGAANKGAVSLLNQHMRSAVETHPAATLPLLYKIAVRRLGAKPRKSARAPQNTNKTYAAFREQTAALLLAYADQDKDIVSFNMLRHTTLNQPSGSSLRQQGVDKMLRRAASMSNPLEALTSARSALILSERSSAQHDRALEIMITALPAALRDESVGEGWDELLTHIFPVERSDAPFSLNVALHYVEPFLEPGHAL